MRPKRSSHAFLRFAGLLPQQMVTHVERQSCIVMKGVFHSLSVTGPSPLLTWGSLRGSPFTPPNTESMTVEVVGADEGGAGPCGLRLDDAFLVGDAHPDTTIPCWRVKVSIDSSGQSLLAANTSFIGGIDFQAVVTYDDPTLAPLTISAVVCAAPVVMYLFAATKSQSASRIVPFSSRSGTFFSLITPSVATGDEFSSRIRLSLSAMSLADPLFIREALPLLPLLHAV